MLRAAAVYVITFLSGSSIPACLSISSSMLRAAAVQVSFPPMHAPMPASCIAFPFHPHVTSDHATSAFSNATSCLLSFLASWHMLPARPGGIH
jgi:hypothetical protein